ncbi:unnamed protein product [Symbiodinium sp. CCMP2592]|nr:unnamed protein product [Symbiodinium sp. CCMP2592]
MVAPSLALYESPLRYYLILDADADIRDLEVGDLSDMESDVPVGFLEHLRDERERRTRPSLSPEEFERKPEAFSTSAGAASMSFATMTLDWTRKQGRVGTDRLARLWATMLETAGLTAEIFAVDPGQIVFATHRTEEVNTIERFVLAQESVDFFEFNQQRRFPGSRRAPLSTDAARKVDWRVRKEIADVLGVLGTTRSLQL